MRLDCDCYPGCWGDHSKGWPEYTFDTLEKYREALVALNELKVYGSYVSVAGYQSGKTVPPFTLRFASEDLKDTLLLSIGINQ